MSENERSQAADAQPQVWLGVDTSTSSGSVAVWRDGLAFEEVLRIQGRHSGEMMLPAVDRALSVTQTSPERVAAFVVGSGPGSFTGVRIAVSLAKGWAAARGTPVFAYSSLLAAAAGSGVAGTVCAMFDARRGQVYAACYALTADGPPCELLSPGAWKVEELLDELSGQSLEPMFVGEGAIVNRGAIQGAFQSASVLPVQLGPPRASSLLWLRSIAPALGRVRRPGALEPLYVRDWRVP